MTPVEPVRPHEPDVAALLQRHFEQMRSQTPEESCHVLPVSGLDAPDIHLFAIRQAGQAVAIGALRVTGRFGELKSMHTAAALRGKGLGRQVLRGLMEHARKLGLSDVALETGSGPEHLAARRLYEAEGFTQCPPFGAYTDDPLSYFMSRSL